MLMWTVVYMGILFLFAWRMQGLVLQFLSNHGLLATNYRHERIPLGLGLHLWLMLIVHTALYLLWLKFQLPLFGFNSAWNEAAQLEYTLLLTIVFFIGWLDDTLGDKQVKGLAGHWRAWAQEGRLTTGFIKAAVTVLLTGWLVLRHYEGVGMSLLQAGVIVLMTNAMNLLDLRPGRTLKGFFFIALTIFTLAASAIPYLLPILISVFVIAKTDLRAKAMLGDMGANLLGFALGVSAAMTLPAWLLSILLVALIIMHWIAERSSLSALIENNKLLHWLDTLGRSQSDQPGK